jgi:hypothetical protein
LLVCCRASNPDVTLASQGSRGGGPEDPVADVAHGGGDPAPEPNSIAGAVVVGAALTMTEPAMEASSSWTQSGDTTPEIVPEVDRTTATTAATAGNGDDVDDELEVVTGHPGL